MKKIISCLIVFLALGTASFPSSSGEVTIQGFSSCGEWVNYRTLKTSGFKEAWLLGFLSGIAYTSDKDLITGTDAASFYLWVDEYCLANPLKNTGDAGAALAVALIKQKHL